MGMMAAHNLVEEPEVICDYFDTYFKQDQRKDLRVTTDLGVEVMTEAGHSAIAVISNLSASGCRLEGSRRFMQEIVQGPYDLEKGLPDNLSLNFILPLNNGTHEIEITVKCAVMYTRKVSDNTFVAGCKFTEFLDKGDDYLQFYMASIAA